jgi:hypothetical protein
LDFTPLETIAEKRWAGRVKRIFVIVQRQMIDNGKANALLNCFVDYEMDKWSKTEIGGMVVYSQ